MNLKYIVITGKDSFDPHNRSEGFIKANVPILIDIFPCSQSIYYGDMTRTFVKSNASKELVKMNKSVNESLEKH